MNRGVEYSDRHLLRRCLSPPVSVRLAHPLFFDPRRLPFVLALIQCQLNPCSVRMELLGHRRPSRRQSVICRRRLRRARLHERPSVHAEPS